MSEILIRLPWPPVVLSPNSRAHWAKVAKAKANYRADCSTVTRSQLGPKVKELLPAAGELELLIEFIPPQARKYDRDNLLARMKAGLDGVCDCLAIDDARFEPITISMRSKPLRRGFVQVTIKGECP